MLDAKIQTKRRPAKKDHEGREAISDRKPIETTTSDKQDQQKKGRKDQKGSAKDYNQAAMAGCVAVLSQ